MALNDLLDRISGSNESEEDHDAFEEYDYEYEDALEPDPEPEDFIPVKEEKKTKKSLIPQIKPRQSPVEAVKLTKKQKDEVTAAVQFLFTMPGGVMMLAGDHVCGGALCDHASNMAEKLVPIICRNPSMVKWFLDGGNMMDYLALGQAVMPIGVTIYKHHVSKTIGHDHGEEYDDLSIYAAPRIQ